MPNPSSPPQQHPDMMATTNNITNSIKVNVSTSNPSLVASASLSTASKSCLSSRTKSNKPPPLPPRQMSCPHPLPKPPQLPDIKDEDEESLTKTPSSLTKPSVTSTASMDLDLEVVIINEETLEDTEPSKTKPGLII